MWFYTLQYQCWSLCYKRTFLLSCWEETLGHYRIIKSQDGSGWKGSVPVRTESLKFSMPRVPTLDSTTAAVNFCFQDHISTFLTKHFTFCTFKCLQLILWEQGKKGGGKAWIDQKKVLLCNVWNISFLNKKSRIEQQIFCMFYTNINEITLTFFIHCHRTDSKFHRGATSCVKHWTQKLHMQSVWLHNWGLWAKPYCQLLGLTFSQNKSEIKQLQKKE